MSLAELINIERPLVLFDLETTGTARGSRIVEIGYQVYRPDGVMKEWRSYIDPEMPIPPEATRVHHITDDMMQCCQRCALPQDHPNGICDEFRRIPTFKEVAPSLAKGFSKCDFGGKQIMFDLQILLGEMARVNVSWSYAGAYVLDAQRIEQILEPRDLSSLYRRRTGKEPHDAHSALADVQMTAEILEDQFIKSNGKLPHTMRQLHELQWPGQIDSTGKFKMKEGVPVCTFGQYRDWAMQDIPKNYFEWIAGPKSTFSEEVKAIALAAAEGRFPR